MAMFKSEEPKRWKSLLSPSMTVQPSLARRKPPNTTPLHLTAPSIHGRNPASMRPPMTPVNPPKGMRKRNGDGESPPPPLS